MNADVIVIGAGLSGLACALTLQEPGPHPLVLEASDGTGGRVHRPVPGLPCSTGVSGLADLVPRGTALAGLWPPRSAPLLSRGPGAVWGASTASATSGGIPGACRRCSCRPSAPSATSCCCFLGLRQRCLRGSIADLYARPESTALARLQDLGFSARMLDRFFKPFFSGVFFDPELAVSSRTFEFCFALSPWAIPPCPRGAWERSRPNWLPA